MQSEQRKHDRFIPQENAYAALGRKYTKVGKIQDISMQGLAFEYIAAEENNESGSQIDIFLVGDEFHLYRVPCKVIYDVDVGAHYMNDKFYKIFTFKRCGVKFQKLNKDLEGLLRFFIQYRTTGKVH